MNTSSNLKVDDSVIFQCGECGNSFQTENDINIHYKTHDDKCQKCSLHKEQQNILAQKVEENKETIGHLLEQLNNKDKANEINIKKSKQNDIIIREAKFEISN